MLILFSKVGKVDTHFTFFIKAKQTEQRINFLAFNKPKQAKQRLLLNCFEQSKVGKVDTYSYLFVAKQSRGSFLLVFTNAKQAKQPLSRQSREFTSCFWQSKEDKVRINLIFFRKAKYLDKVENYFLQLAKQTHIFTFIYKGKVGKVEN